MTEHGDDGPGSDPEVVVRLPESMRAELKDPLGPVYTDADDLLAAGEGPVIAVGDVVTYHLLEAGRRPDVALVDGKTKREAVDATIWNAIAGFDRRVEVSNPPATLSADLLSELRAAVGREGSTVVVVEGEEDLAALPAVVLAPDGASVVYGQPDEGMVHGAVTPDLREEMLDLLSRMDGDIERLRELLGPS
jgi:hypothetical protein